MSAELIHALEQIEKERGINKEVLIEAIEVALVTAYRRNFGSATNVEVYIDRLTGDVRVFALKKIVDEVNDPSTEISLEQANQFDPEFAVGDVVEVEVTPRKFGRIAAQTAKQVVVQRIREAERELVFEEFSSKEDDIVTGVISRFDRRNVIVDLGRVEAILPPSEQIIGEKYNIHDRIKAYVINVKKTNKSPQIFISRTHPGLVKRLLELEVPEIHDGTVEIKNITREAGSRSKIAIYSKNENVDPVGACVGQKGSRIRAIVDELKGEMIDVIKWSSNPEEYIASSLSPAKVVRVDTDEEQKVARVIVPDFQLSLAIGKEGQNARLAAKLTGWKIDIKSESQLRAHIEQQLFTEDSEIVFSKVAGGELDNVAESLFVENDVSGEPQTSVDEGLDTESESLFIESDTIDETEGLFIEVNPDDELDDQLIDDAEHSGDTDI
ncbi:MAG: transcription termination/antitermination protein NusA [Clostridiaceae bacterium]|jgi:N utilization substance protein A|nr:transcription termination/antitermination protein NusA [Clostridiaceae bacterium]